MRQIHWPLLNLLLISFCLIAGCGYTTPPLVTVTMKSAESTETASSEETTEEGNSGTTTEEPVAEGAGPGSFEGIVLYEGDYTPLPALFEQGAEVRDKDVCVAVPIPNEKLLVNPDSKGIKNVFVYLDKAPKGAVSAPPPDEQVFDQSGCVFVPHVMIVRTKKTLLIKSDDTVAHNTHTFPERQAAFNQAIPAKERAGVQMTYTSPERKPVQVKCDYHPWMEAYHLPIDHSFAALTDAEGKFKIEGLPPGSYTFRVWHEKGGDLERGLKVTIKAGAPTTQTLKYGASRFTAFRGELPKSVVLVSGPEAN